MGSRLLSTFLFPPVLRQRLLHCGFNTQADVQELQPLELAKELSVSPEEALEILKVVRGSTTTPGSAGGGLTGGTSALELLQQENSRCCIYTLSQSMDSVLGGGVQIGEMTEFCGVPGIGKTQLGMQLACNAAIPGAFNGPGGGAIYIDTEGSFMSERVAEIARGLVDHIQAMIRRHANVDLGDTAARFNTEHVLRNIHFYRLYDYTEQLACIKALPAFLHTHPEIRIIVMDSVAFHFRRGFKDFSLRARVLTGMAQDLLRIARDHSLAVVVMNQVTTKLSRGTGTGSKVGTIAPALGESWSHACTNRVMLHWDRAGHRHAQILKSPSLKMADVQYYVTSAGIRDHADGPSFKRPRDDQEPQAQPRKDMKAH